MIVFQKCEYFFEIWRGKIVLFIYFYKAFKGVCLTQDSYEYAPVMVPVLAH